MEKGQKILSLTIKKLTPKNVRAQKYFNKMVRGEYVKDYFLIETYQGPTVIVENSWGNLDIDELFDEILEQIDD